MIDVLRKSVSFVLVGVISVCSLSGCALNCNPHDLECQQRQSRLNQTTAEGAFVGALLGVGIAALTPKSNRNRFQEGALAGLLVGGVAGSMVGQKQDYYYTKNAKLEKEIQELQAQNAALSNYNQNLRTEISMLEDRINEIKNNVASVREQRRLIAQEKSSLQTRINADRNDINALRRYLTQYQSNYEKYKSKGACNPEIENEINGLHQSITEYDQLVRNVVSL